MAIKFVLDKLEKTEISKRVRAIIGVPEQVLTDDVISSPTFIKKAEFFINNSIKEHLNIITDDTEFYMLEIAAMYYIGHLLCVGMYARLPKQMENLSTKTILQNINWDKLALDLLDKAREAIDDFLEMYDIEETNIGFTFADLSDEQDYPADVL